MGIVSDSVMAYGRYSAEDNLYADFPYMPLHSMDASNRKTRQRMNDIEWNEQRKMCYFTSNDAIHVMMCHINFIGILFDAQLGIMKII